MTDLTYNEKATLVIYVLIAVAVGYFYPAWSGITGKLFAGATWPAMLVLKPIALILKKPVYCAPVTTLSWLLRGFRTIPKPLIGVGFIYKTLVVFITACVMGLIKAALPIIQFDQRKD